MNKKRCFCYIFIILFLLIITPIIKSQKIKKIEDWDIETKDNVSESCKCKNSIEKENNNSKENDYYLGLLKGGEKLPPGKEFSGSVPSSFDWRHYEGKDWTTRIKDQGMCGSCYAFGIYSAMESCIKIKSNKPNLYIDLSEQFMVSCGTNWMGGIFGCEGAYLSSILDFIEIFGAIPESCLPYTSGNGFLPPCSDKCQDWEDFIYEIDGWGSVFPSQSSLKNALIQYGPLTTGMEIYENFLTYSNGIYNPTGDFLGYHLVSIVGYNDDPGYWVCKNSWGRDWGENGWFRIKYDVCEIEEETLYLEVQTVNNFFNIVKCGTETYKRSGDIYDYNDCTVSMSEHLWSGSAYAWYRFNISEIEVTDSIEIGIQFCDRSAAGNGPNLHVYLWKEERYSCLGKNLGHWYTPQWVWKNTSDSNKYINDNGIVEVLVTTEDEDFTLLCKIGLKGKLAKSNLKCSSNLHFGPLAPGQIVVDNINIENIGYPGTELGWEVVSWPNWGEWNFSPLSGKNLTPEQGSRAIIVSITAPYSIDRYDGEVIIINLNDESDFEIVEASLSTSKNKNK